MANVSGPDLSAVIPNAGSVIIPGSDIDPFRIRRALLLRFNEGQQIDPASFAPDTIPAGQKSIQIINKATGQPVEFGYINIGDRAQRSDRALAESLPDGDYQLKIFGTGDNPLKNKATPIAEVFRLGEDLTLDFTLDLGPAVISVVPAPIARGTSGLTQARDKIEVYFDQELDAATATNRLFYQLIATQETATPDDDVIILPSVTPDGVVYDPVAKKVTLKFDDDLANLVTDPLKKGNGAFRLRIGNAYEKVTTTPITVGEAGENYYTAENLSASFGQASGPHSVILTADILASHATPYNLEWPGAVDEPGHRDLPANMGIEDHLDGDSDPDGVHGITNFTYSFPDIIGTDSSSGSPLFNLITAAQKQRARDLLDLRQLLGRNLHRGTIWRDADCHRRSQGIPPTDFRAGRRGRRGRRRTGRHGLRRELGRQRVRRQLVPSRIARDRPLAGVWPLIRPAGLHGDGQFGIGNHHGRVV